MNKAVTTFSWDYDNSENGVPATEVIVTVQLDSQTVFTVELPIDKRTFVISHSELSADRVYTAEFVVRNLQGYSAAVSRTFNVSEADIGEY